MAAERARAAKKIQQARRGHTGPTGAHVGPRGGALRSGRGASRGGVAAPGGGRQQQEAEEAEPSLFGDIMGQLDALMLPINVEVRA